MPRATLPHPARRAILCTAFALATIIAGGAPVAVVATEQSRPETALPAPEGDVILTVSGKLSRTNDDGAARLDMAMLEAMPATEIQTQTIWTKGVQSFTGVELRRLIDELGIDAETLGASAINDYRVDIPVVDAIEGGPIVAYKMNGDYMSRRGKGPLWIVYPYDANIEYRKETIYNRSIWQLDRLSAE